LIGAANLKLEPGSIETLNQASDWRR